mmetsp:Transcript_9915/g.21800  ORF Transcript_9915/g.21800 Transcript_9915/m.21800 type:complete len:473 (-) Transcript_9915:59-1477(-)|eukprot:CAMPEP_0206481932 /NCGR_PEP_ID=MMETSP0324_2-20121206/38504_1 /ASSEMBLY_ACC=CAM_ASM_000836 /TAXON_ID=2866 /ORGANISM="Crypthecodinium cohnii, Strain Seligo" /LENGTH=472 /DNA_ID=CAMNT_0053959645 /DNA_START=139 /DNA_END=1557 /DNA_ORIENTATION=+
MSTPEEFGCDERASELVRSLPLEQQQMALEKLKQGIDAGKVRNASAYIVGVVHGPDLLGVDDRAMALLKELPEPQRKAVINKYKQVQDVRNPSAWIAKAVNQAKHEMGGAQQGQMMMMMPQQQQMQGQRYSPYPQAISGVHPGFGFNSLDTGAQGLLRSLPENQQQEILGKLMMQPHVNNPSAWVAKAALAAGAVPQNNPSGGGNGGPSGSTYEEFDPQVQPLLAGFSLDAGSRSLLLSLPVETQVEIASKMVQQQTIKNPSGWIVKACLSAGAKPVPREGAIVGGGAHTQGGRSMGNRPPLPPAPMQQMGQQMGQMAMGQMGMGQVGFPQLDQGAKDLLGNLPMNIQQEILSKLAQANPKNPSGWVVKAALSAGARPQGGNPGMQGGAYIQGGIAGQVPVVLPPGCEVDMQAQQLLGSLPPHEQQDIVAKLTRNYQEGKVQNPSGWVVKAAIKAGAHGNTAAQGNVRFTPY